MQAISESRAAALDVAAIEAVHLSKTYHGDVRALHDVNLRVERGAIFGLLGQNGAGKTTLIRILLDMIRPTGGHASLLGADSQRDPVAARRRVAYLSSSPRYYPGMTGAQMFDLMASLRGVDLDRAYVERLLGLLELDPTKVISTLSRGNQQKVGLIATLVTRPELAILDEPTSGLDPVVQEAVLEAVRDIARDGRTVFLSSHNLPEVEEVCDRAAVLRNGELVGTFDLAAERRMAVRRVTVTFADAPTDDAFADLDGITLLQRDGVSLTFALRGDIDPLVKRLAIYRVREIEAHTPTLDDFFFSLYRDPSDRAPAEAAQ